MKTTTTRMTKSGMAMTFTGVQGGPVTMWDEDGDRVVMSLDEARKRIANLMAAGWRVW